MEFGGGLESLLHGRIPQGRPKGLGQFDSPRAAFRAGIAGHAHPQRRAGQQLVQVPRSRFEQQFARGNSIAEPSGQVAAHSPHCMQPRGGFPYPDLPSCSRSSAPARLSIVLMVFSRANVSPLPLGEGQGVRATRRTATYCRFPVNLPHPNLLPKGRGDLRCSQPAFSNDCAIRFGAAVFRLKMPHCKDLQRRGRTVRLEISRSVADFRQRVAEIRQRVIAPAASPAATPRMPDRRHAPVVWHGPPTRQERSRVRYSFAVWYTLSHVVIAASVSCLSHWMAALLNRDAHNPARSPICA